jgi:3-isopropylmalate/(R)-2-methylmalate dehydratase large subunit
VEKIFLWKSANICVYLRLKPLSLSFSFMAKTLYEKVWDAHAVATLPNGQTQLLIGTHLIHEVTSPQAFGMLRQLGLKVHRPDRTFATVDHIVPTNETREPYSDPLAQEMISALRKNCADFGITFFDTNTGRQGVVHIVGPEQGITQPGMTIACGDSHTATHEPSARSPSASAQARCATFSRRRRWRWANSKPAALS